MTGAIPPTDVTPTTLRRGFCIKVYDTPQWRSNVLGALKQLSYGYYWNKDDVGWEDARAEGLNICLSYMDSVECQNICQFLLQCLTDANGDVEAFLAAIIARIISDCEQAIIDQITAGINSLVYPAINLALTDCGLTALMDTRGQVGNTIDLSTCSTPGQPGEQPGGGSPPVGTCFDIDVTVKANQPLLIPYPVTANWTVTITNPQGSWSKGNTISDDWACYDGHNFVLGVCGSGTDTAPSTAPCPACPLMALVLVGPTGFTPVSLIAGATYTIPPSSPTGNYFLQANDDPISDNAGEITLHLHVCNEPAPSCDYDFTTGEQGWSLVARPEPTMDFGFNATGGHYVSATGFVSDCDSTDGNGNNPGAYEIVSIINKSLSCSGVRYLRVHYTVVSGDWGLAYSAYFNATQQYGTVSGLDTTPGSHIATIDYGGEGAVTQQMMYFYQTCPGSDGHVTITDVQYSAT